MENMKKVLIVFLVFMTCSAIAQEFTPYYLDLEYAKYSRSTQENEVQGDFNYNFSGKIKNYIVNQQRIYDDFVHTDKLNDSVYYVLEISRNHDIVIRYFDDKMNLIDTRINDKTPTNQHNQTEIGAFVRNDTLFQVSIKKDIAKEKDMIICATYNISDASRNNRVEIVFNAEKDYFKNRGLRIFSSDDKNYYALLVSDFTKSSMAANNTEFFLLDKDFDVIKHQDSLIACQELFDKYPSMYVKDFWSSSKHEFWMQDIKLSNNGEFTFCCMTEENRYCNRTFDYYYILDNNERTVPMDFCFVSVPKSDSLENKQMLIRLGNGKFIQDVDYVLLDNDSVLISAFYRTKEDLPHNIASFICSKEDESTVISSDFHIDNNFRIQYTTQAEKEGMIKAKQRNKYYYSNVYKSEDFIEFSDGYISIYNSYVTYQYTSKNAPTIRLVYNMDYYLSYYSKDGELQGTYKIPQRRVRSVDKPELLYSIVNGEMFIAFADGRLKAGDNLFTSYKGLGNRAIVCPQFVVYKIDEDFNFTQYTAPIDKNDFNVILMEKDFWFSDTELLGIGTNKAGGKYKFIKIDLENLTNPE